MGSIIGEPKDIRYGPLGQDRQMPARGRKAHTSWHNQVGYCFVSNNDIEIFSEGQG